MRKVLGCDSGDRDSRGFGRPWTASFDAIGSVAGRSQKGAAATVETAIADMTSRFIGFLIGCPLS